MKSKDLILSLLFLLFCIRATGQSTDVTAGKLYQFIQTFNNFSQFYPQEKVYLHFDNTSYYQGDNIWFKCYVVTTHLNQASEISRTLYVELLNPGGDIIDKRVLRVENGQCHGEFTLNKLPFYSGFFEVRAYTKYMLNFGDDAIFSRLVPVFSKPKEEGNFEEKDMQKPGSGKYPMVRKKPLKEKKVNLNFFPEGGNLIQGIRSQVAFEATDAFGNPITVTGTIVNEANEEISRFSTEHEGRGVFGYTPVEGKSKAIINFNDKKYTFDMPVALPHGFVLTVDNVSETDSIGITIQKNRHTPVNRLGLAVISRGEIQGFYLINAGDKAVRFKADKAGLPAGVTSVVLFGQSGEIICDRLLFTHKEDLVNIEAVTTKKTYAPYEPVDITFKVTRKDKTPVQTPFSLSVNDSKNEVGYNRNILTDLLLMSEIKGYVNNPSYYFETDDEVHRTALDLLLRVQGWRRYDWNQMTGTKPFELKNLPEHTGIVAQGQVVSFVRGIPKPNVEVSSFLLKRGENDESANFIDAFKTDSLGKFAFLSDVEGKWDMILSVTEKGKKKDHRIILNRLFSPEPGRYRYADLKIDLADEAQDEEKTEESIPDTLQEENVNDIFAAFEDSLRKAGNQERVYHLDEVVIKAKKRTKEKDIYESRTKSIAYYDVSSEWDDLKDQGKYIGKDIHELMINMNRNFSLTYGPGQEYLLYKGRTALFVINYERTMATEMDMTKYKIIRLEAIKSIYVSEDLSTMLRYADPRISPLEIDKLYGCAVLVETYPEDQIPADAGKGVRKTWLEGYSQVKEFYSPDYSVLPPETDYRRTLYWNPSVVPDQNGNANIRFYNNSRCRKFRISAETITPDGVIGIYTTPPHPK